MFKAARMALGYARGSAHVTRLCSMQRACSKLLQRACLKAVLKAMIHRIAQDAPDALLDVDEPVSVQVNPSTTKLLSDYRRARPH